MSENLPVEAPPQARATARLAHAGGLHARPSIRLTQVARAYAARIWLASGEQGPWIDAKSIARVMTLKAPAHSQLHFRAEGGDAEEALAALVHLVAADFPDPGRRDPPAARAPSALHGTPASAGLALGPLVLLDAGTGAASPPAPGARDDAARLRAALAAAGAELGELARRLGEGEAAALMDFQLALLADPVLVAPALAAAAKGEPAEAAWRAAMARQLRELAQAEDPYFRARTADLRDLEQRVLRHLAGAAPQLLPRGAILVADDLPPSRFLELAWDAAGFALRQGGLQSHVALLARARGLPLLVGLEPGALEGHEQALLDAERGLLLASPGPAERARYEAQRARAPATPRRGVPGAEAAQPVRLLVNIDELRELEGLDPAQCDGIGLVRTELLLRAPGGGEDEAQQFAAYRRLVQWAGGRPVTIRTLDEGGDKPPAGPAQAERNPLLGLRGVRRSLREPQRLLVQLRAIARAAALGPVTLLVPMVTQPAELEAVRGLLDEALAGLHASGADAARPALGMMVEVPAAAFALERFGAERLSIGSNDLIAFLTASARDEAALAGLQDPLQPAVLLLLAQVVAQARALRVPLSLCGDMAAQPACLPALLELGLREFSVPPAQLARVRCAVAVAVAATAGPAVPSRGSTA